ncbi:hypothetical protein, partial [Methylobacterium dankookense]|uniref:hypothetical protein n=1 Tax=Methylobacterium dankookense TaxID=560405 RepID=UPI001EDFE748
MLGFNLIQTYAILQTMGVVRSKRQFSREWLKRGWSYLRDIEQRDRGDIRIPAKTVLALRARVSAVARLTPPQLRSELATVRHRS